jgi:CHAD domain-containing protein
VVSGNRSIEQEIKLSVDPGFELSDLSGVVSGTIRLPEQHTRSLYFDTPDLRLWRRAITLRHRSGEGPGFGNWTLKLPITDVGPTLDRTELSWSGGPESIPLEATKIVRGVVRSASFVQIAELAAVRRRLMLHDAAGTSCGEIDDDTVSVMVDGEQSGQFRQIEFELGPSGRSVVDAVVDELLRMGARPDGEPKLGKALRILGHRPDRAGPPMLNSRSSMEDVVEASISLGFERLLGYDTRLRLDASDPAPSDVHQVRVAIRRLRSDLKLLARELDPAWTGHVRLELGWLGGVLGLVRDADVLGVTLLEAGSVAESGGTLELRISLDEDRRSAARDLAEILDGHRYLTLLERLDTASRSIPLRTASTKHHRHKKRGADAAAKKVLPGLVRRRWRALRRTVRSAGRHPTDGQLHKVRIRAKQLRYAAETATPVIGRASRRLAAAAEDLQTILGEHHDSVAAEDWLRRRALSSTRSAAFSSGILVAGERRRQRKLRRTWRVAWDRLDTRRLRRSLE